jgi:predicted membrane-bound spermidine synthase
MKSNFLALVQGTSRLAFDFLGGVHASAVWEYVLNIVASSSLNDALQVAQGVDIHLIAAVATCVELAHSLHRHANKTEEGVKTQRGGGEESP